MSATEATPALGRADTIITTGDHKRIGRLYLGASFVFLLLGGALGGLLGAERATTGLDVLDEGSFGQVLSLHGISAAYLFLLPAWVGLATYVVPLQVGARNVALPRLAAASAWGYGIGGALLVASYVADGGPTGGDAEATELWITSLGMVLVSLTGGLIAVVATVLVSRAPGLSLRQVPAFSWAMLAAGAVWVLSLPVLVGTLVLTWVDLTRGGGQLFGDQAFEAVAWAVQIPQIYLLAVPALGVVADVLATFTGGRIRSWPAIAAGTAGTAALGFGAHSALLAGPGVRQDFLFQAMGLAIVAPVLICLAAWADIVRRRQRVNPNAAVVFAVGAAIFVVLGVGAGMALSIDGLDLDATTWVAGQVHLVGLGAGTFGLLAGVWMWAPKLWGARLHDGLGYAAAGLLLLGTAALAAAELATGIDDMPLGQPLYGDDSTWETLSQLGAAGAALTLLATLAVAAALVRLARTTKDEPADPWEGGQTLEWLAASPPAPHNFDELPEVLSEAPLLDTAAAAEARS